MHLLALPAGTLPPTLAASFALGPQNRSNLDLSANQLSGPLPAAWGSAGGAFTSLSLGANFLSGTVPPGWAPLIMNGQYFDLSKNSLSGALPAALNNGTPPALQWWLSQGDGKRCAGAGLSAACGCGMAGSCASFC